MVSPGQRGLPGVYVLAGRNYAFAGRLSEAEALFERLLALRNHLGFSLRSMTSNFAARSATSRKRFRTFALIMTARNIESMSAKGQVAA